MKNRPLGDQVLRSITNEISHRTSKTTSLVECERGAGREANDMAYRNRLPP